MPDYCALCSLTEHSESPARVLLECRTALFLTLGGKGGCSVRGISNRQIIAGVG